MAEIPHPPQPSTQPTNQPASQPKSQPGNPKPLDPERVKPPVPIAGMDDNDDSAKPAGGE